MNYFSFQAAPAGYVQGVNVSADISASSLNVWVGLSDLYDERGTSAQTGKTLPKSHNLAQHGWKWPDGALAEAYLSCHGSHE